MKKYNFKNLMIILFAALSIISCKKELPEASTITYWPDIVINGNVLQTLIVGESYVDAGATVTSGGVPTDYTTDNPVDTSLAGVYKVTYYATNKDGIEVSKSRTVIVLPGAVTTDVTYIEGSYETPGGTTPATTFTDISKITAGVYYTGNCWGNGSLAVLPAYFFCLDGVSLIIPLQGGGGGQVITYSPGTYDVGTSTITWTITRPLFTGGPLTRTKNWTKV